MDTSIRVSTNVRDLLAERAKVAGVSIGEMVERLATTAPMTDTEISAHHDRLQRVLGWSQAPATDDAFATQLANAFTASADGGTVNL